MTQLDSVLGKIDSFQTKMKGIYGRIEGEANRHKRETPKGLPDAARDALHKALDQETAEKRAEADRKHEAEAEALRADLAEALADARRQAAADHRRDLAEIGPRDPTDWQEAESRAFFVREDIKNLAPGDLLAAYRAAKDSNDRVGAWLIIRYGLPQLKAQAKEGAGVGMAGREKRQEARQALEELEQEGFAKIEAKHTERLDRIHNAERWLTNPLTSTEKATQEERLAARFGIRA